MDDGDDAFVDVDDNWTGRWSALNFDTRFVDDVDDTLLCSGCCGSVAADDIVVVV